MKKRVATVETPYNEEKIKKVEEIYQNVLLFLEKLF